MKTYDSMKTYTVVRWKNGSRTEARNVEPFKFDSARAKDAIANAAKTANGPWADAIDDALTDSEIAYVLSVWESMSGESCFIEALYKIRDGAL